MNLESINKWLDEEYGCSYTRLEELHNFYFEKYTNQKEEIKKLNEQLKIMEKYLELIYDLGYDYDGLNKVESLKSLIDEMCKYASLGRAYNITEPIYVNDGKKYNIIMEELKGDNK